MGRRGRAVAALLLASLAFTATQPPPAEAGWVDDWMASKTTYGGGYFQGQNRGYLTGGAFSARWINNSDHLMTVEPPRIKAGCGGVNMFVGGISFMDFDYLVQKFQNVLMSAASVAFDMALGLLCPVCKQTVESMEGISNFLNGLQMNDCALGTAIATSAFDKGFGESVQRGRLDSNTSSFGYKWNQDLQAAGGAPGEQDVARTNEQCAQDWKEAILGFDVGNAVMQGGSVMDNLCRLMGGNNSFTALARGLVGDVYVSPPAQGLNVSVAAACPENQNASIENFLVGQIYARGAAPGAQCVRVTDVNADFRQYVETMLTSIADKMKARNQALTQAERDFLDGAPLPLMDMLRASVATYTDAVAIPQLSDYVAALYVQALFQDLYGRIQHFVNKAKEMSGRRDKVAGGGQPYQCQPYYKEDLVRAIEDLQGNLRHRMDQVNGEVRARQVSQGATEAMMNEYRQINLQFRERLGAQFGKSVVNRVSGR